MDCERNSRLKDQRTNCSADDTPTAEEFAVEVQWVDGRTQILPFRSSRIEQAERKVEIVTKKIQRGDVPGWRRAYVVTTSE